MIRPRLVSICALLALAAGIPSARAQGVAARYKSGEQVYGTSWGEASYGLKRTKSAFASPRGVNYGLGTPPLGFVPGKFGSELWGHGESIPAGTYGVPHTYRTFPYPYPPGPPSYGPSIGVYAPGFGPELRSATTR